MKKWQFHPTARRLFPCLTVLLLLSTLTGCDGTDAQNAGKSAGQEDTMIYVSGADNVALYQNHMSKYFDCTTVDADTLTSEPLNVPEAVKNLLWVSAQETPAVLKNADVQNLITICDKGDTVSIAIVTAGNGIVVTNAFDFVPREKTDPGKRVENIGSILQQQMDR